MWKRISAFLFDMIITFTVAVGFAFLLSFVLNFDAYTEQYNERREAFEEQYGVSLDVSTEDEYDKLSDEERARFDEAFDAFSTDPEANYAFTMIFQLTLILATFSIMLSYIALDFVVPLIFGNGQTLGKKMFGLGVMRVDGVRISPLILFIRTILGKFTIETMVPIYIFISMLFGAAGPIGLIVILIILITGIVLLIKTPTRSAIHDMLAHTVCVDMTSQLIFENADELLLYKQNLHKEKADNADY